jgi:1,4-dihydroxy-2-naphthoyl-CoA hydrolase
MTPIWITPLSLDEINKRMRNTLSDHLGIEFIEVGDDHLTASMPVDPRTCQPMGILHGGASCALAETVGSAAANYCVDQSQKVCVGLDINANHLRPVRSGSWVRAVAKPLHLGRSTQVWEIKIYNQSKQLVSVSRLTMAIVQKTEGSLPRG